MLICGFKDDENGKGFTFRIRARHDEVITPEKMRQAMITAMKMHLGKDVEVKVNARSSVG